MEGVKQALIAQADEANRLREAGGPCLGMAAGMRMATVAVARAIDPDNFQDWLPKWLEG